MQMQGTYLLILVLIFAFAAEPDLTTRILTAAGLKIQIFYINYRMKWMAWRMYRSLCALSKQHGMPSPGPFRFVNIWDRQSNS